MQGKHVRSTPDKNALSKAVDGTNLTRTGVVGDTVERAPHRARTYYVCSLQGGRVSINCLCSSHTLYGWLSRGKRERFDFTCMELRGCVVAVR